MTERKFTEYDAWNCNCKEDEIGKPWEPRWGNSDITAGLCVPKMLGKPIPAADLAEDGETPAFEPPMITSRLVQAANLRGIPLDDAEALAMLALQLDPEAFMGRNPTIYRDLIADQRQKRIAAASQAGKTRELTAKQIDSLYQADMARFVAQVVLEILPLETAQERQSELFRLLKITPEELTELLD